MKTLFQLEIPKRSTTCVKNNEKLQPGMEYYSLLSEEMDGKIKRHDFCIDCWQQQASLEKTMNERGFWKSKIDNKVKAPLSTRAERALALLKDLLESTPDNEVEIFFLTLLLSHMRKITLRKEYESDGFKYGLYEIQQHDEFLTIKIVDLTKLETDQIQNSLAKKLNSVC